MSRILEEGFVVTCDPALSEVLRIAARQSRSEVSILREADHQIDKLKLRCCFVDKDYFGGQLPKWAESIPEKKASNSYCDIEDPIRSCGTVDFGPNGARESCSSECGELEIEFLDWVRCKAWFPIASTQDFLVVLLRGDDAPFSDEGILDAWMATQCEVSRLLLQDNSANDILRDLHTSYQACCAFLECETSSLCAGESGFLGDMQEICKLWEFGNLSIAIRADLDGEATVVQRENILFDQSFELAPPKSSWREILPSYRILPFAEYFWEGKKPFEQGYRIDLKLNEQFVTFALTDTPGQECRRDCEILLSCYANYYLSTFQSWLASKSVIESDEAFDTELLSYLD